MRLCSVRIFTSVDAEGWRWPECGPIRALDRENAAGWIENAPDAVGFKDRLQQTNAPASAWARQFAQDLLCRLCLLPTLARGL